MLLGLLLLACTPASTDASTSGTPTGATTTGTTTGTLDGLRLTTPSGVVEGELIASYDQSTWEWTPADETWLALFDPTLPSPVQIVADSTVSHREPIPLTGPTWRDHLRQTQVLWTRPPLDGVSHVITGHDTYHLTEDGYGDFAWDLVRTGPQGTRFTGAGTANPDFRVWSEPVYAATAGTVVEVVRAAPDNPPGSYPPDAVNNLVGIRLTPQLVQYYLHFRQDSIPPTLTVGTEVSAGDYLGDVGNSGVSLEPHLHLTLHAWVDGPVPRFWSVPSEWSDVEVAQSPTGSTPMAHAVPSSGDWVAADPF